jgi:cytochrome c2
MLRPALAMAALCGTVAVVAFVLGFVSSDQQIFPSGQLLKIKGTIREWIHPASDGEQLSGERLETTLIPLRMRGIKVNLGDDGTGGALASVGSELSLLTRLGDVFVLKGTTVHKTKVQTPNNYLEEYRAAAKSKYPHLTHDFRKVRYNDLLFLAGRDEAMLVISYTEWRPEHECYCTAIARVRLSQPVGSLVSLVVTQDEWEVVYRTKPCLPLKARMRALEGHMAGGRIAPAGQGRIYLGSGDYHLDGVWAQAALPQQDDNDYGKILEIDLNKGTSSVVSKGHRNVQGIATDAMGRLWATEHGPRGGDELNLIRAGQDYGWPRATLGTRYNKLPWPAAGQYGRHDHFQPPVFAWLPSIGISNVTVVADFDRSWDGDLLVAALEGRSLYRVRVSGESVQFAERIEIGERIRYVLQHTEGRLVLWTDAKNLIVLTKDDLTPTDAFINRLVEKMDIDQGAKQTLLDAIVTCSECHAFERDLNGRAPSLGNVFGRAIAGTTYDAYSQALTSTNGRWNADSLTAFVYDGEAFAPGTSMPPTNISLQTSKHLVSVLEALALSERGMGGRHFEQAN